MTDLSPTGAEASVPNLSKRALDESHTPSISSPLNPNAPSHPELSNAASRTPKSSRPPAREQREKRDSLKKREATGAVGRGATPETPKGSVPAAKKITHDDANQSTLPLRYTLTDQIKRPDWGPPKPPMFTSHEPTPLFTPDGETEMRKPQDHAENRRNYRYTYAVADPLFPHSQYFRASETQPFGPRMSFEDTDKSFWFNGNGRIMCNEKGWRMGRANVVAREGRLFYEVKILRGVPATGPAVPPGAEGPLPHIRMGWARREASLDAPVGFDGYSYGVTDIRFETMHRSRPGKFFRSAAKQAGKTAKQRKATTVTHAEEDTHIREGDVVGLEIILPSLKLQRKIVDGTYSPEADNDAEALTHCTSYDVVRDRVAVHYKSNCYFEQIEYAATKPIETYGDRTLPSVSNTTTTKILPGTSNPQTPHPLHADAALRTLPNSSIRVYKNGRFVGSAFDNLLCFLPPASVPSMTTGNKVRSGLDDSMLGYFPAVAAFTGGVAEVNLGPDFWFPPKGSGLRAVNEDATNGGDTDLHDAGEEADPVEGSLHVRQDLRPISERFGEQIAEDVLWDIIDEVSFFAEDGGPGSTTQKTWLKSMAAASPSEEAIHSRMVE